MNIEKRSNPYNDQLVFFENKEQLSGITFVAKYNNESQTLTTRWNTYKTPREFKLTVEQQYGANIAWKNQIGITPESLVWLDTNAGRAEIQLQTAKTKDIRKSIETIREIASETVMDGVVFPEIFDSRLETYIS
jgi:hypothetical protein